MTTDSGGWILVGRNNNITSSTWSIPSNNKTVTPYGVPHLSSTLGDVPILDFRVQVATSENFKATKAHWYVLYLLVPIKICETQHLRYRTW